MDLCSGRSSNRAVLISAPCTPSRISQIYERLIRLYISTNKWTLYTFTFSIISLYFSVVSLRYIHFYVFPLLATYRWLPAWVNELIIAYCRLVAVSGRTAYSLSPTFPYTYLFLSTKFHTPFVWLWKEQYFKIIQ